MDPAAFDDAINGNKTIILNQFLLRAVIFVIACTLSPSRPHSGSVSPCTQCTQKSAEMKQLCASEAFRHRFSINSYRLLFYFGFRFCVRVIFDCLLYVMCSKICSFVRMLCSNMVHVCRLDTESILLDFAVKSENRKSHANTSIY